MNVLVLFSPQKILEFSKCLKYVSNVSLTFIVEYLPQRGTHGRKLPDLGEFPLQVYLFNLFLHIPSQHISELRMGGEEAQQVWKDKGSPGGLLHLPLVQRVGKMPGDAPQYLQGNIYNGYLHLVSNQAGPGSKATFQQHQSQALPLKRVHQQVQHCTVSSYIDISLHEHT